MTVGKKNVKWKYFFVWVTTNQDTFFRETHIFPRIKKENGNGKTFNICHTLITYSNVCRCMWFRWKDMEKWRRLWYDISFKCVILKFSNKIIKNKLNPQRDCFSPGNRCMKKQAHMWNKNIK